MSLDVDLFDESTGEGAGWFNITHNLNTMANEAGIYQVLWRAPENSIETAAQLIEPLRLGLRKMTEAPTYFQQFDAANGWGTYEHFVPWLSRLLEACLAHPDAKVSTNR